MDIVKTATDWTRAYVVPMLVAGTLILIIGVGLFFPSQARLTSFPAAYAIDSAGFIVEEIARADRVLNEYRIAVFRIIPLIVAACALAILYFETPHWRASLVTTIAMMAVILVIDTNANARLEDYREQLALAGKSLPTSM